MLVVTRRQQESVMIGTDITVTVLAVKGKQVRIGINAPKDVAVHREEILSSSEASRLRRVRRNVSAGFINSWMLATRHPRACCARARPISGVPQRLHLHQAPHLATQTTWRVKANLINTLYLLCANRPLLIRVRGFE